MFDNGRTPTIGRALRQHKVIAAAALVACTAGGVAWGYSQPVEYVAQAQLIAGATGVSTNGLPAQAAASQSLAASYARVFSGDAVQTALREAVGPDVPRATASPIPDSSIILIEVEAEDPDLAVRTADAGVDALEAEVAGLLSNAAAVEAVTASLTEANVRLANAERALAAAQAAQDALPNPEANPAVSEAVAAASAAAKTADAEVDALTARYTKVIGESAPANAVRRLASGELTADTSARRIQLGYAVGVVGGCIVGGGLAYALAAARARRRPSGPLRNDRLSAEQLDARNADWMPADRLSADRP